MKYDAVIIGAGLGGLVTATYLAKYGFKICVIERTAHYGGCAMSFPLKGFMFDGCVHSIGSLRSGGYVSRILDDFQLADKIIFSEYDPSDVIISKGKNFSFFKDQKRFQDELVKYFPKEVDNVSSMIRFINNSSISTLIVKLRRQSFYKFLSSFISNEELKSFFSLLLLGNAALPAKKLNGYIAAMMLKEFIFDGGYYPKNSIQNFSDRIAEKALAYGCDIKLKKKVKKILIKNKSACGVLTDTNEEIESKIVIANSSVPELFNNMLDQPNIMLKSMKTLKMRPSLSAFSVFLGLDDNLSMTEDLNCNAWFISQTDTDLMYSKICKGLIDDDDVYVLAYFTGLFRLGGRKTMALFVNAPYLNQIFWRENKEKIANNLIKKVEGLVPSLRKNILFHGIATPLTVEGYTASFQGATYGWEPSIKSVFNKKFLKLIAEIENLFIVGHWTACGLGVPFVMEQGRLLAKKITTINR